MPASHRCSCLASLAFLLLLSSSSLLLLLLCFLLTYFRCPILKYPSKHGTPWYSSFFKQVSCIISKHTLPLTYTHTHTHTHTQTRAYFTSFMQTYSHSHIHLLSHISQFNSHSLSHPHSIQFSVIT